MNLEPNIHVIAAALADRSRARMVCALMDGRAYTAKELAYTAEITPQTASAHLKVLEREGLIAPLKSGRNKYLRLASPAVAQLIESLSLLSSAEHVRRAKPRGASPAMLEARSCYDHIAGRLGTALLDALCALGYLERSGDDLSVTAAGEDFFTDLGIDVAGLRSLRRPLTRCCLDWTERRHHLAGSLGAALMTQFIEAGWLARERNGRALRVTASGQKVFAEHFGLNLSDAEPSESLTA